MSPPALGYLQSAATNRPAVPRARPLAAPLVIFSALPRSARGYLSVTSGMNRAADSRAPYTAARHATSGRLAHHRRSVEICPFRTDFSLAASALISLIGR
jgi:hypothetical protein